ncbi:MAG TPA: 3-oxoacyl-ACP reductase FabG [Oscillospiraceae bacterium]|nr:3-oxoacyl-ACP reductase FabG [Oscillospiraceae bacterium]
MMKLENKVAIITGGAKGIGYATAKKFMEEGAAVAIFDVDKNAVEAAVNEFSGLYKIAGYVVDITSFEQVETTTAEVFRRFGHIDILVNNAGIISDALLHKMTPEQFSRVIGINLTGSFNCAKAAVGYMIEQQSGVLLNAASIGGIYGNVGQSNYSATKGGVIQMAKVWAKEYGKYNIRANAVAPGLIDTPILKPIPQEILDRMIKRVPMRRLGLPGEIANVYAFLASDEASFVTGEVIEVSGGYTY